jgi:hypothetical protein
LDYQDVKLKIIQQEGYDAHDFNLFHDRASLLWRKPYVDGAVRELTAGNGGRSVEQLRRAVEQLMLAAGNKNPNVKAFQSSAHTSRSNVRVDVDVDQQEALIKDMRRNPGKLPGFSALKTSEKPSSSLPSPSSPALHFTAITPPPATYIYMKEKDLEAVKDNKILRRVCPETLSSPELKKSAESMVLLVRNPAERMISYCGKVRRVIGESGFGPADLLLLQSL